MTSTDDERLLPAVNEKDDREELIRGGVQTDDEIEMVVDERHPTGPANGLTVLTATVLMVGEMAGSGILALPHALDDMGYIGIIMIVLFALISAYTGKLLGTCWLIIQERYEEYRGHVRHPYPVIGQVTYGRFARIVVSISNNFTMFGGCVVFLILASQNIQGLLRDLCHVHISFCYILLIVAGVLLPLSWLGTPKDFWPIAVGAALATGVACFILVAAMVKDKMETYKDIPVIHTKPDLLLFFEALGILMFAYGGHPAFPTIQMDMKEPVKFGRTVFLTYIIMFLMYFPVALAGFLIYGLHVQDNVLKTISPGPLLYTVQILITCHLFCSFVIVINPVVQEIEELFNMRKEFSWRRIITRSCTVLAALFIAETIPKFGTILSLVGGSSMVILVCILPPLFYLKLRKMEGDWPKVPVPFPTKMILTEIILIGISVAVFSTYGSIKSLVGPGTFTLPCYLQK